MLVQRGKEGSVAVAVVFKNSTWDGVGERGFGGTSV